MDVILLDRIANLGNLGDKVSVKAGKMIQEKRQLQQSLAQY